MLLAGSPDSGHALLCLSKASPLLLRLSLDPEHADGMSEAVGSDQMYGHSCHLMTPKLSSDVDVREIEEATHLMISSTLALDSKKLVRLEPD